MKKILIVNTSGLGVGGITTHMLNYLTEIKRIYEEVEFYIVVTGVRDDSVIKNFEIIGCNMLYLPDRKKKTFNYILSTIKLLNLNNYDVIHVHGNSSTMCLELFLAKIKKVKTRIAHCHNSKCEHKNLNKILYPIFRYTYTVAVACSKLAGDWIFGKGNFLVIPNSIDVNKFSYDEIVRSDYRKSINVNKDEFLVGHIGNFNEQKNHKFLINTFYEIQKNINSKLLLIGTGSLVENVKKQIKDLNIEDRVIFLGLRNDVNCWLQAMDVFVFPSRWEGFGMVLIEAQASNLPIYASTEVPVMTRVTDKIKYLSLEEEPCYWAKQIINDRNLNYRNQSVDARVLKYDIRKSLDLYLQIYDMRRG